MMMMMLSPSFAFFLQNTIVVSPTPVQNSRELHTDFKVFLDLTSLHHKSLCLCYHWSERSRHILDGLCSQSHRYDRTLWLESTVMNYRNNTLPWSEHGEKYHVVIFYSCIMTIFSRLNSKSTRAQIQSLHPTSKVSVTSQNLWQIFSETK